MKKNGSELALIKKICPHGNCRENSAMSGRLGSPMADSLDNAFHRGPRLV